MDTRALIDLLATMLFVIAVVFWVIIETQRYLEKRSDEYMRKVASDSHGRIYKVDKVTLWHDQSTLRRTGATLNLTDAMGTLVLNLTNGHYNLTDTVMLLEGRDVMVMYQENPAMQKYNGQNPKLYLSYWLRVDLY